jgi:hypothetical protein
MTPTLGDGKRGQPDFKSGESGAVSFTFSGRRSQVNASFEVAQRRTRFITKTQRHQEEEEIYRR